MHDIVPSQSMLLPIFLGLVALSACDVGVDQSTPVVAGAVPPSFGIGRQASEQDIAKIDIDVRPDGKGLPTGHGTAVEGQLIYQEQCAFCHGKTGVEGPNDVLAGHPANGLAAFFTEPEGIKTIGNYWPYATTVFDYVRRSMPLNRPGSLSDDQVYAVTAYLLYINGLLKETDVLDAQSLPRIVMPANAYFYDAYSEKRHD